MDNQPEALPIIHRRPPEITVQARLCDGGRPHCIGDLITYRSTLWMVKGLYLGATRAGQSELYYILSEAAPSFEQVEEIVEDA